MRLYLDTMKELDALDYLHCFDLLLVDICILIFYDFTCGVGSSLYLELDSLMLVQNTKSFIHNLFH